MTEKVVITLEYDGTMLIGYDVAYSDSASLEKKMNGVEPYYQINNLGADKLRIETYFGQLSGPSEIKGGNNWCLPTLAILFTQVYDEQKVPLKQSCKLSKIRRWVKTKRPFDLNSEWVE